MKIKQFLKMGDDFDTIEIIKDKQVLYNGSIENYLKSKKTINGTIKSWSMYVVNWDYPVLQIVII